MTPAQTSMSCMFAYTNAGWRRFPLLTKLDALLSSPHWPQPVRSIREVLYDVLYRKKKKRKTNQLLQKDPSQQVIQSPSNRKYREPLNSLRDSSHYPHQENPARSRVQI